MQAIDNDLLTLHVAKRVIFCSVRFRDMCTWNPLK